MARGKQTCKILKEIRKQIAEANDIELITSECRYKGDCRGTCPKCEAEVRYLEQQLHNRLLAGKTIALAGISAGIISLSGCSIGTSETSNPATATENTTNNIENDSSIIVEGELDEIMEETQTDDKQYTLTGEVMVEPAPDKKGNDKD